METISVLILLVKKFIALNVIEMTLQCAVSVDLSFLNVFKLRVVFALRPLPNCPRLSRRVFGLV